jgi:hypothetical protein
MTLEEILQTLPQDPFFQLWCALLLLIPLWVVAWMPVFRTLGPRLFRTLPPRSLRVTCRF